ncbi:LPS export ABC transporter periplasmic protein LptC [Desulfolithobacter sp.]
MIRLVRNPRNLLWLLPMVVFLTAPLWKPPLSAFLAPRMTATPVKGSGPKVSQNFTMDSMAITLASQGQVTWVIHASRARTGKNDNEILMDDVQAVYAGGAGGEKMEITSRKGTYYISRRHLILEDNVVLQKPARGEEMLTDLLHYYDETKMVISPVEVEIKSPDFILRAGRMEYDLVASWYDFSNRVVVDF